MRLAGAPDRLEETVTAELPKPMKNRVKRLFAERLLSSEFAVGTVAHPKRFRITLLLTGGGIVLLYLSNLSGLGVGW